MLVPALQSWDTISAAANNRGLQYTNPIGAGNQTKKPSLYNRFKGFFTRKKNPNVAAANRGLNAYKGNLSALMPKPRAKYPNAAAAARTRKNRR